MPSFDDFKRGSFLPGAGARQKQREEEARKAASAPRVPNTAGPQAAWGNIVKARRELAGSGEGYDALKLEDEDGNKQITDVSKKIYEHIADLDFSNPNADFVDLLKKKIEADGSDELKKLCDSANKTKDKFLENLLIGFNELRLCNSQDIKAFTDQNGSKTQIQRVGAVAMGIAEQSEIASKVVFASKSFPNAQLDQHGFDFAKKIAQVYGAKLLTGISGQASFTLAEKDGKQAKLLEVNITPDTNPAQSTTHCIATYTLYNPIKNQPLCKEIASTKDMEVKSFSDAKAIAAVIRANGIDLNFSVEAERDLRTLASDHLKSWMGTMTKADYNTINDFLTSKYGKVVGSGNPADEHSNVKFGHKH